ncbi:MAG: hypothetical protein QOG30_3496 [Acidimicrobiaceae bacterium]
MSKEASFARRADDVHAHRADIGHSSGTLVEEVPRCEVSCR